MGKHFVCPHPECQVDAQQAWHLMKDQGNKEDTAVKRAKCGTCGKYSYWVDEQLAWPAIRLGDQASDALPDDVREVYNEARDVVAHSPRAAAALLRLGVERLVSHLGETSGRLDERIGRLADAGDITRRTVDALDAVRLTGNNAVHEGQIDPEGGDDRDVALLLFQIVNRIADDTIGMKREVEKLGGGKRKPKASEG